MTNSKPRTKAFAHKSRHGCDPCKQRHVKCDEEKPFCMRCRKHGLDCKYTPVKVWLFKPSGSTRDEKAVARKAATQQCPLDLRLWTKHPTSVAERHAFQHWLMRTGPWIGTFVTPEARPFWQVVLPRLAVTFPSLMHLLIATALLDEGGVNASIYNLTARAQRVL
jgi:hypothetical protein